MPIFSLPELMSILFAFRVGTLAYPTQTHSSEHTKAPDHPHQHNAEIPPLSNYRASEFFSSKQIEKPDWDSYHFHMLHDHPINAAKHRQSLDKDFKEGLIDKHLHEKEIDNSKHRERAVQHVINGGIAEATAHDVIVYHKDVNPEKILGWRRNGHLAQLHTIRRYRKGDKIKEHHFQSPPEHLHSQDSQRKRQRDRITEKDWMRIMHGHGKQADNPMWGLVQEADALHEHGTPPPSPLPSTSPPSSPSNEKGKKKVKLNPFKDHVWQ